MFLGILFYFLPAAQPTSGLGCPSAELVSANWHPYIQAQTPGILLAVVQASHKSGLGPPNASNNEPGHVVMLYSADLSSPTNHD